MFYEVSQVLYVLSNFTTLCLACVSFMNDVLCFIPCKFFIVCTYVDVPSGSKHRLLRLFFFPKQHVTRTGMTRSVCQVPIYSVPCRFSRRGGGLPRYQHFRFRVLGFSV